MAFKLHEPKRVPVKVYRATDKGAPTLKTETGSLKTLLKACLVNGYGSGDDRKEPLGWAVADETPTQAIFYSTDSNANPFGLKVDNSGSTYIVPEMYAKSDNPDNPFPTKLGYTNNNSPNWGYNSPNGKGNWLLVGHSRAFIFVLPENNQKSQILFFGDVAGLYEDTSNTLYINSAYGNNTSWDDGYLTNKKMIMPTSQYVNGGTDIVAEMCEPRSMFWSDANPFPDVVFKNCMLSSIFVLENVKTGGNRVRATIPALYSSFHDLSSLNEFDRVPTEDGQHYVKLMIADGVNGANCFALNIQEWEL